jgi:EmrB/QacA subfamily drug resistance transporter
MTQKRWTLIAVCVATFMLLLDVSVVNVALPSIRRDLHASFADLQWLVDAYALSLAAFVLTSGSLADRLGRRRVFSAGLVVFTAASALCALSTSPTMLNCARAVQGAGGAAMFAVSLALLAQEFRGRERAAATSVYGAVIAAAIAAGPLVGGALTTAFGWQSIFVINIPIGVAALVVTFRHIAESRDPMSRGVDWAGTVCFSTANALLVLALIRGNEDGWGSAAVVGSLIAAALLLCAFVAIELRVDQPMLPLRYFRNHAFTGTQVAAFAVSASMFALYLYITLYIQNILGHTALETGLIYLPSTIVSLVVAGATAALTARVPPRALLSAGLAVTALGMVVMSGRADGDAWTALLPGFVLAGIGVGLLNPVIANLALSTVPEEHSGVASGINDTFRQVGIATGVAGLGAVFLARATSRIAELLPGTGHADAEGLAQGVSGAGLPAGVPARVVAAAREGFLTALNEVLLVGAGLAIAGAVLTLLLVRASDIRAPDDLPDDVALGPAL